MKKWLENYWYHHKWATIIVAFFAMIAVIGIVQMFTHTEYDAHIIYAGPAVTLTDSGADGRIAKAFESLLTKDRDGDGEIHVLLDAKTILSDEQLAEKKKEAAEQGDHVAYDVSIRQNYFSDISTLLLTGQVSICLFDPYVYGRYTAEDHFVPLSEVLDEIPAAAYDEYAVRLKDTDFGKQSAFSSLPDDTLICLHISVSGKKAAKESYEYCRDLFRAALLYSSGN